MTDGRERDDALVRARPAHGVELAPVGLGHDGARRAG
jgi:hypothetical protein